jgi:hypothetical protein
MEKLSREELKKVTGGHPMVTIWKCQDVQGGPYISTACYWEDPAGGPFCPEYSCYNTGVLCSPANPGCS